MRVKSSRRSAWCAACMCRWLNEESRDYDGMGLVSGGGMKGVLGGEGRTMLEFLFFCFLFLRRYFHVLYGDGRVSWRCIVLRYRIQPDTGTIR